MGIEGNMNINLTKKFLVIGDRAIEIPCHIDTLKEIFGEPEKYVFGEISGISDSLNAVLPVRTNYVWNELGVIAYTYNGFAVATLEFRLRPTRTKGYEEPSFYPEKMFSGNITINGKPWIELIRDGELSETEIFKKVDYGKFKVFGGLADWHHIENCLAEEDYTHISFNRKRRG